MFKVKALIIAGVLYAGIHTISSSSDWSQELVPGFTTSESRTLPLWSKTFVEGSTVAVAGLRRLLLGGMVSVQPGDSTPSSTQRTTSARDSPPRQLRSPRQLQNFKSEPCVNPTCASPPCNVSQGGDVGCTTVSGTETYDHELTEAGDTIPSNAHIFGAFEAGFTSLQQSIIEDWGCTDASLVYDEKGGLDLDIATKKVAHVCSITLPRVEGTTYYGITGPCGGHTNDYHFHGRFACLYTESGAHSTAVGNIVDKRIYGKWENFAKEEVPLLDACGGHFGPTPDSLGSNVYHYHVQDTAPFTVGCHGPNTGNTLVSIAKCIELYTECTNPSNKDELQISATETISYVRYCPCFDQNGCNNGGVGGIITELEALNSTRISKKYAAGSNVSTYSTCKTTSASSTTTTTNAQITSTPSTSTTTSTTTEVFVVFGEVIKAKGGGVAWNAPVELQDHQLTNPGQSDHTLEGVPEFMLGGIYIGSGTWPKGRSWEWRIVYNPPVRLYIWAMENQFDAGIHSVLSSSGWSEELVSGFTRSGTAVLKVWSMTFVEGSAVTVAGLSGRLVGGVVSVQP